MMLSFWEEIFEDQTSNLALNLGIVRRAGPRAALMR